jgi:glyoxylase-like metal-dependent hydrolase (beta-lactamase superfamily II)
MSDESPLLIEQFAIGQMDNLVHLVGSKTTREVALVDPAWEVDRLLDRLESDGLTPKAVLVTHFHPDHIGGRMMGMQIQGLPEVLARYAVPIYVHKAEAYGVRRVTGISDTDMVMVEGGDTLSIGEIEIEFMHTPGHTPGSQCFRVRNMLVSGDTLFIRGCGRVDLPGGSADEMYDSLQRLAALPDDTYVLPGHDYGGGTVVPLSEVKQVNPYMRAPSRPAWRRIMGEP